MKPIFIALSFLFSISLCGQKMDANKIVNACIKAHGGELYQDAHFAFDFRKYHYEFHYDHGDFRYERHHEDGITKDILTNKGFRRFVDNKEVELVEKKRRGYSNSVNSVNYFAFLPFFLNDQAVHKKLIGETTIQEKDYYKIQVTFDQDRGGDDHDDVYVYWIGKEDFSMDYLGYSFHVNNGGVRFRSAFNKRKVAGITFQDYVNYKHDKDTPVKDLDTYFIKNELKELSKIELKNIQKL